MASVKKPLTTTLRWLHETTPRLHCATYGKCSCTLRTVRQSVLTLSRVSNLTMSETDKSDTRFTLYYSPTSYFSHKVQLAFYEKNEPFTGHTVNVRVGEGIERWYMLINPTGQVPVLGDRGKIIPESEDIIDYLDKQLARDPRLVPSLETDLGKKVDRYRKLLTTEVPIAHVTHGVWYNPELSPADPRSPWDKAGWEMFFEQTLSKLSRLANENEDLREAYVEKIASFKARMEVVRDASRVKAAIDSLHPVLDQVEGELSRTRDGSETEQWLCGSSFTVADISLAELLNRLTRLGLDTAFISPTKRSALYDYWQRVQNRPSFIKVKENEKIYKKNS